MKFIKPNTSFKPSNIIRDISQKQIITRRTNSTFNLVETSHEQLLKEIQKRSDLKDITLKNRIDSYNMPRKFNGQFSNSPNKLKIAEARLKIIKTEGNLNQISRLPNSTNMFSDIRVDLFQQKSNESRGSLPQLDSLGRNKEKSMNIQIVPDPSDVGTKKLIKFEGFWKNYVNGVKSLY